MKIVKDNRAKQITNLLDLIESVNKRIVACKEDDDALGIWQYVHQKQDFVNQLQVASAA